MHSALNVYRRLQGMDEILHSGLYPTLFRMHRPVFGRITAHELEKIRFNIIPVESAAGPIEAAVRATSPHRPDWRDNQLNMLMNCPGQEIGNKKIAKSADVFIHPG